MANSSAILRGVSDPGSFYLAVMNSTEPPDSFPLSGFSVHTSFWDCPADLIPIFAGFGFPPNIVITTEVASDGTFEVPAPPASWPPAWGGSVSMLITDRAGNPIYRTAAMSLEFPVDNINQPIWIYTPADEEIGNLLPLFTVGDVATAVAGIDLHGLIPLVTSSAGGLTVTNDPQNFPLDLEIEFGIRFVPSTAPILANLLGAALNGYDIKISGFAYLETDTASVKSQLLAGIGGQTPAVNQAASQTLTAAVTTALKSSGIADDQISDFLGSVTSTIAQVLYSSESFYVAPAEFNNQTQLVSMMPRIGFPRKLVISFD
jgi:hypothetical protein